jgi:carbamoyl-phosphate synthase large subunit
MNILITSSGKRDYLIEYFKEAVGKAGLVYASNYRYVSSFNYADEYIISPDINSDLYIDFIIDFCKKKNISAVIPLYDLDVLKCSQNSHRFSANRIHLLASSQKTVEICHDKWSTYQFLLNNKFNTPKTYIEHGLLVEDIRNGFVKFPLMVKPRYGNGSIGTYKCNNFYELDLYTKLIKLDIERSLLKHDFLNISHHNIIFQEFLIGEEYGLDIINDLEGNYQNTIIKLKLQMSQGETFFAEIVANNRLKLLGKSISELLQHKLLMDTDIMLMDDKYYILDLNPRFGGGYPFSHNAGINLPKAIVEWLNDTKTDKRNLHEKIGNKSIKKITILNVD